MIEPGFDARVKINQIIENQLPEFLLSESPKSAEFLKQYYISQEYQSGTVDIVENLDQYLKLDNFTAEIIKGTTTLEDDISSSSSSITVASTKGFPDQYGLLKIDSEIITYTGISGNTFTGCIRGFSGITTYRKLDNPQELEFSTSNASSHTKNSQVINLSALFLQEFYKKLKYTLTPGLENTAFVSDLNVGNFIKEARSFYQAKGTPESFRILFNVLYGENPTVFDLENLLIKPSDAKFSRRRVVVAELLNSPADPLKLIGQTLKKSTDSNSQVAVSEVEILARKGKTYYKISLFIGYDDNVAIQGQFNIQPQTKVLENVSIGASIISVDSTIGFGQTGTLISGTNYINYTNKSVNQFFGCNGITNTISATDDIRSDEIVYGFENGDLNKKVELRLTGVLSEFVPTSDIYNVSQNEVISIKNIGEIVSNPETNKSYKEIFANSWIYNTSSRYQVENIFGSTFTLFSTPDKSSLDIGDNVDVIVRGTENIVVSNALITNINQTNKQITLVNLGSFSPSSSLNYDIRRKIKKASSDGVPLEFGDNNLISNIQNLYVDDEYAYICSNSLPSYTITKNLTESSIPEATGSLEESAIGNGFLQGYSTSTLKFSQISFSDDVQFISGDEIVYEASNPSIPIPGLTSGESYYVQVLNPKNKIRLYASRSFVGGSAFLEFDSLPSGSGSHRFILAEEKSQVISPQKILRKFPLEQNLKTTIEEQTEPGSVGILINGVEITSPKSNDKLYYGPLSNIEIINSGKDYDVLNPPEVVISSSESGGSGALANVVVRGSVKKITVDPQEFDLDTVVSASISGGNGFGAILKPIVSRRYRELEFDARQPFAGGGLDLSDETISFKTTHNFVDGEPIVYNANGNPWLGIGSFGPPDLINNEVQNKTLINGSTYYAKVVNSSTIKLYEKFDDYLAGINTVGFTTENNGGVHKFRTVEKNTLRSIEVINFTNTSKIVTSNLKSGTVIIPVDSLSGISTGDLIVGNSSFSISGIATIVSFNSNNNQIIIQDPVVGVVTESTKLIISKPNINEYENRKLYVKPVGISTFDHTITFTNHNFKNGDLVKYDYTSTPISGISTENNYYILKLDNNTFRLADAGIGTDSKINFERNKFVKFNSVGSGYHIFKYPDITLTVNVSYGGTVIQQINAVPTISGEIVDVYLYENGVGYGSSDIVNLKKTPKVSLKTGKNAEVRPIVNNGRIVQVDVLTSGSEYVSTPNLIIQGSGVGAVIRPVIQNQKLVSVIVINSGVGYVQETTSIQVVPAGSGASLQANIRELTVNKQSKISTSKKEILVQNENLEYSWIGYDYNLAESSFGEVSSNHSPIIGWAYDGNPIYGPYGFTNPEDNSSTIKLLKPGYVLDTSKVIDRPNSFSPGFFIEDYNFNDSGDLDKHNGRFCKTPEFPLGIYAYFVGVSTNNSTSNLDPIYPYFIGNTYRSSFIRDNITLDQSFDFNNSNLSRNTFPYKVSEQYAGNDFLVESNEIVNQISLVEAVSDGSINDFTILEPGNDYKVGDLLNFDNSGTDGGGLSAVVSSIEGKKINSINTQLETYNSVVFKWKDQENITAVYQPYHQLLDNDSVVISGLSSSISGLSKSHKIGVTTSRITLFNDIPSNVVPRAVVDLYVSHIPQSVSVGSSIVIENETLEVLNIFNNDSILRVRRSDVGASHTVSTPINILPNSFNIPVQLNYFDSNTNDKIFFNPKQSVGLGTTVGASVNLNYIIGSVTKEISVPTQSIYLPNHPFKTGQEVILNKYSTASPFIVSNSASGSSFNLPSSGSDSQTVYVINKSKDYIGITTTVGLTTNTTGLFFLSDGDDNYEYNLQSNFTQVTGNVSKINSTIYVSDQHQLLNGDQIKLAVYPNLTVGVGQSSKVRVKYEDHIQKLVINPVGFDSSAIDSNLDIITISSHNLETGDKIFYNSLDTIASGLSTGNYFVYKIDDNKIKLTETLVDLQPTPPVVVDIIGVGGSRHEISLVNPQLLSVKNNNLLFDVSDPSLEGYKLKFYYDQDFNNEFIGVGNTSSFNIIGIGTVGIGSTASVTLRYNEKIQSSLYYTLEKSGYISTSDTEVKNYSQILFVDSVYNGTYKVSGIGTTSFNISLTQTPEKLSYIGVECDQLEYKTSSKNSKGGIADINILFGGYNYKKAPKLLNISTDEGKNANVVVNSSNIGNIKKIRILDQGFEYSADKTLRPQAYVSPFINISNSNSITKVEILDGGKNYSVAPTLIIKNPSTNKIVDTSQSLRANIYSNSISSVDIISPIFGLESIEHEIVPINNSNGVGISSIISSQSGIITCILSTPILGFSTNVFAVGNQVLVEGIQKEGTSGTGFNSEDYNYSYFPVVSYQNTNPAVVEYDISSLTTNPGIAKTIQNAFASIVNKQNLPQFKVIQKFNLFNIGEQILTTSEEEFILRDLYVTESSEDYIKVRGTYLPQLGEILKGRNSGVLATINNITQNTGKFNVDYFVLQKYGWNSETGKLNETHQVSSDNDYYQNLSYTIKSSIQYNDLIDPVNRLLHTSGLKNFSDTQVTSKPLVSLAATSTADDLILLDITDEKRVDSINNYDFVVDVDTYQNKSKLLKLKNKTLSGYINCISNRVLIIDDVSSQFSSRGAGQDLYANILTIEDTYHKYLVQIVDPNTLNTQVTELVVLSLPNQSDVFTLEKSTLTNTQEVLADVSAVVDEIDLSSLYLRFTPTNPLDIDYDIKILEGRFNSTLSGINTQSIGFIDLVGVNTSVGIGTTSNVISFKKNKLSALFANIQIVNNVNNSMNYVELFLDHDNVNTYLSEYYFDTSSGVSTNFLGSFNALIDGDDIVLNFYNDEPHDLLIRSKVVGFGTTSVGIGTYAFTVPGQNEGSERTMYFESNYGSSTTSIDVIGISTELSSTVKSLIRVSYGETSSLHQVLMLQDRNDIYTVQYPFLSIGSTSGIGTFGGEFSGNQAILKFYPDNSVVESVSLQSFNEIFYTESDFNNIPPDLEYGTVTESFNLGAYDAINGTRAYRTSFSLNYQGVPIYAKTFNPTNSAQLNPSTGIFTIKNHFFSTGERLIYTPRSTFADVNPISVGIGSTLNSLGIVTDRLPQEVYAISVNSDQFKLSTRQDYAYAGIYVTFTDFGLGNAHQLEMGKKLEKSIITIDGVVQKPITYTPLSYYLENNGGQIQSTDNYFSVSGISTLKPTDLLKIDDEFVNIISVGFGSTPTGPITGIGTYPLVQAQRGFVGSAATNHLDHTIAQVYRGSFNIVDNKIHFTQAPKGSGRITNDRGNIPFPYADFGGRIYLRNDYTDNILFDDISDNFTGIGQTYQLSVLGIDTYGIGDGSGVLFINDVFQTPTTLNNEGNNYNLITSSGISSVVFTGISSSNGDLIISNNDINQNQLPRGGVIISLGSTPGLGFAPLVGASVTAIVSGGTIVSVGIGSTDIVGSGYRGTVSIGVTDSAHTGVAATITATVGAGGTLAFNVVYGGSGYVDPIIQVPQPSYENLEIIGVSRRGIGNTTDTGRNLLITLDVGASSTTGIGSTLFEVSSFNISRPGYGFEVGDVFKPVGLVTDKNLSAPISEFELTVLETFTDSFSAWQFGELDYIDSIKNLQNGVRVRFPLLYNSQRLSFEKNSGSLIDLNAILLIFVNSVIQEPGVAYQFEGGSSFVFTEPPKVEDNVSIFFYRGTRNSDSISVNVNETIKIGDLVQVYKNNLIPSTQTQNIRRIDNIPTSDTLETNIYSEQGIDEVNFRPFTWTKQKVDAIINGDYVYKTRDSLESQIYPTSKIISDINSNSTDIFVDDAQFFNYEENNYSIVINNFDALIVQNTTPVSAGLTAVVSAAGTIQSLNITNPGSGYIGSSIEVKISAPKNIKVGVGSVATATASIVNGSLSSTTIVNPGLGYTTSSPPQVIVENPPIQTEKIDNITNVEGFSGIITGITTSTGTSGHPLAIKFFANATSFSGLQPNYPIYIFDTFVGTGITSVDSNNTSIIGVGTEFVNNVYKVHSISVSGSNAEIISNISTNSNIVGLNTSSTVSNPLGMFSWGRLYNFTRLNPVSIGVTGFTVDAGLSTFPTIQRRGFGLRDTGAIRKTSNI